MKIEKQNLEILYNLRHDLHAHPEVSGEEKQTARRIVEYLKQFNPDEIITELGGHGVAAVFKGEEPGKRVLVRAELDALPIAESNLNLEYKSIYSGKGHKCGHDGHMVMVAGLAQIYGRKKPRHGDVVLLFQPAEETGEGAQAVCKDSRFQNIYPDYAFSLHNIPGEAMGSILCRPGPFSSSVESVVVKITGKTSHAAEPEYALSAGEVIAPVMRWAYSLNKPDASDPNFQRIAVTGVFSGSLNAYGTTAGAGEMHFTLRARTPERLDALRETLRDEVDKQIVLYNERHGLLEADALAATFEEGIEPFKANINDSNMVDLVRKAAQINNLTYVELDMPYPWGEDFGYFTNLSGVQAVMFGLGAGNETPVLHHPAYDFPDEIIVTGISMFAEMIESVSHTQSDS